MCVKVCRSWALRTEDMYTYMCTQGACGEGGIFGTWNLVTSMGPGEMGTVNLDFLLYSTETFHKQVLNPESVPLNNDVKNQDFLKTYELIGQFVNPVLGKVGNFSCQWYSALEHSYWQNFLCWCCAA